jgi:hypothetical protein
LDSGYQWYATWGQVSAASGQSLAGYLKKSAIDTALILIKAPILSAFGLFIAYDSILNSTKTRKIARGETMRYPKVKSQVSC